MEKKMKEVSKRIVIFYPKGSHMRNLALASAP
jgi:hypothetical protein